MSKKEISLVLGTVSAVVVFFICIQLKTLSNTKIGDAQSITEDNYLIDEILETRAEYESWNERLEYEEKNLEAIRKQISENSDTAKDAEKELSELNKKLGLTDVTGEGIIITLDDNRTTLPETLGITIDAAAYLVHYMDVIKVINELWNAGAEAISVNGQRIVSTTAISCIGNVISINGEKAGVPFVISAIGNQEYLYGNVGKRQNGYIDWLEDYGLVSDIKKASNIFIPKFSGKYSSEFMEAK